MPQPTTNKVPVTCHKCGYDGAYKSRDCNGKARFYCLRCERRRRGCTFESRGRQPTMRWLVIDAWLDEWGIVTPRDVRKMFGLDARAAKDLLVQWTKQSRGPKLIRIQRGVYARYKRENVAA